MRARARKRRKKRRQLFVANLISLPRGLEFGYTSRMPCDKKKVRKRRDRARIGPPTLAGRVAAARGEVPVGSLEMIRKQVRGEPQRDLVLIEVRPHCTSSSRPGRTGLYEFVVLLRHIVL